MSSYPANVFTDEPKTYVLSLKDLRTIDPDYIPIPTGKQQEVELAVKIHSKSKRLKDIATINRGEINQTTFKKFISSNPSDAPLLKGVEVRMYGFNEVLSQGERKYFRRNVFLKKFPKRKPPEIRISTQRITGIDERRRLVCAISRNSAFFADSTNSIVPKDKTFMTFLLGLLNSDLLDWRFKLTSTNNNVGTNELEGLPFPAQIKSEEIVARIESIVEELEKEDLGNTKEILNSKYFDLLNEKINTLYDLSPIEVEIVLGSTR